MHTRTGSRGEVFRYSVVTFTERAGRLTQLAVPWRKEVAAGYRVGPLHQDPMGAECCSADGEGDGLRAGIETFNLEHPVDRSLTLAHQLMEAPATGPDAADTFRPLLVENCAYTAII